MLASEEIRCAQGKTSQSGAEKIANGKPDMRQVREEVRVFACAFVSLVKIKIALFHHHLFHK